MIFLFVGNHSGLSATQWRWISFAGGCLVVIGAGTLWRLLGWQAALAVIAMITGNNMERMADRYLGRE